VEFQQADQGSSSWLSCSVEEEGGVDSLRRDNPLFLQREGPSYPTLLLYDVLGSTFKPWEPRPRQSWELAEPSGGLAWETHVGGGDGSMARRWLFLMWSLKPLGAVRARSLIRAGGGEEMPAEAGTLVATKLVEGSG
jgi:hypothetical protein